MSDVGVVTYIDNVKELHSEFWWLFKSWEFSHSDTVSDLICFYNPTVDLELLPKKQNVYYIPSEPLSGKDSKWADYPFVNSVYYLTTKEAEYLTKYTYLLRTDNDCFLTRYFPLLRPRLATFGVGMYAQTPIVVAKLAYICEKWGVVPQFNNVGSTVMANSYHLLEFNKLHMEYCNKMLAEEFPDGKGEWPNWFKGVLTMYAGNLAANHYFGTNMVMGGLDCLCTSQDYMCQTDYHIHAWHTWDYFSKFRWRNGEYRDTDFSKLDTWRIADYCLAMAGPGPVQ